MRVMITGGGTGGHIYPALAMARTIRKHNPAAEILFVGAVGGMEEKIVPAAGFSLETLPVKGFSRRKLLQAFPTLFLLVRSWRRAHALMRRFRPDLVFGTGGFASAPALLAALAGKKRVIIHEQNLVPGVTNRFLAPWVDHVCLSFEASKKYYRKQSNLVVTGNPRASEMVDLQKAAAREGLKLHQEMPLLLACGGSRGAARINQCMVEYLEQTDKFREMQVLYITGEIYYDQVTARLCQNRVFEKFAGHLTVKAYLEEMPLALAAADLVICRAGATTLAEITALGVPAILIPSPHVVHDHQRVNALALAEAQAAVMLEEKDLHTGAFKDQVDDLLFDPLARKKLSLNSRMLGKPDAAEQIFALMVS